MRRKSDIHALVRVYPGEDTADFDQGLWAGRCGAFLPFLSARRCRGLCAPQDLRSLDHSSSADTLTRRTCFLHPKAKFSPSSCPFRANLGDIIAEHQVIVARNFVLFGGHNDTNASFLSLRLISVGHLKKTWLEICT